MQILSKKISGISTGMKKTCVLCQRDLVQTIWAKYIHMLCTCWNVLCIIFKGIVPLYWNVLCIIFKGIVLLYWKVFLLYYTANNTSIFGVVEPVLETTININKLWSLNRGCIIKIMKT